MNVKGILAELNLLHKFIDSFGISQKSALNVNKILPAILEPITYKDSSVRSAALKVLIEVHRKTGVITEEVLKGIPANTLESIMKKISKIKVEKVETMIANDIVSENKANNYQNHE